MQHHEFSPSHLEQIRLCPGSHIMQKGIPDRESPWAAEGTLLHEAIANDDFSELTDEQKEIAERCIDFLNSLEKGGNPGWDFERKLEIKDEAGTVITYGYADVIIRSKTKLIVIDWKFGYIPVKTVAENIQLASYALGALQAYPEYKECECWVFQPRIRSISTYTFKNPANILTNIQYLISQGSSEELILRPSDSACRYCKARLGCPAFRSKYQRLQASLEGYDLDDEKVLSQLYAASLTVKGHINEIESALKQYITEHGRCGGYVFQTQNGAREIKDLNALYDSVKDYLTPREFNEACKVSVSRIETMLADKFCAAAKNKGEKLTKAEGKNLAGERIAHLVTRAAEKQLIVEG